MDLTRVSCPIIMVEPVVLQKGVLMAGGSHQRQVADLLMAVVAPGSDYPAAHRVGTQVTLQLDAASDRVLVTRARGRVVVAYLSTSDAPVVAGRLRRGLKLKGVVDAVALGPAGKMLRIRLE